ncbi:MAG: hypothetical protein WDN01_21160 [Rhizomicrobium sp.]
MRFKSGLALVIGVAAGTIMLASSAAAETIDQIAAKVLALDTRRVEAWQKKDWARMKPMISDDVYAFSVTTLPHDATGKAAFFEWAARQDFPKTLVFKKFPEIDPDRLNNHSAWIIGADKSVAIVTGVLQDTTHPKDNGETYVALYYKKNTEWQLLRYIMTVNGKGAPFVGATVPPPGPMNPSLDALPPEGKEVAAKLVVWHDSLARRVQKNFPTIFSDRSLFDRGDLGYTKERKSEGVLETGQDYVAGKIADPSGAPEVVGKANPVALVLGKSRDVVVLNDIRADATGGSSGWSIDYVPQWRNWMNEWTVWERKDPTSDDWRMTLWAGGQYYPTATKPD